MSPEAVDYMSTAEALLARAERNFLAEIYEDAARNAYLAALHAARAVIFDKTGGAPKSHSGTGSQFHRLLHEGLQFPPDLVQFLGHGFEMKQNADYGPIVFVSHQDAEDAMRQARAFVAAAKAVCV